MPNPTLLRLALAAALILSGRALGAPPAAPPEPPRRPEETLVKDVVRLEEAFTNKLSGEGLVVGLAGTGDKSARTKKLALRLYREMGGTFALGDLDSKNMAAVIVTADLPPFKARGDGVDVTVASTEGAASLKNGILLTTNLVGPGAVPEGMAKPVLAFAQGPVLVGDEKQPGGGSAGHLTVGRVPNGGVILDPNPGHARMVRDGRLGLLLRTPDFANAQRVAQSVNAEFDRQQQGASLAQAVSASLIEVVLPEASRGDPVAFISRIMELPLVLVKERARVVVNARTGVVTYSGDVRLSAVQVSFGGDGENALMIEEGGTLSELLSKLDKVATPAKKIEILNNLHSMGALRAELVIL
mgnify:CR=1 FL=1